MNSPIHQNLPSKAKKKHVFCFLFVHVMSCYVSKNLKNLEIFGEFIGKKHKKWEGYTTWLQHQRPKPRQVIGRAKTPWEHGTSLRVRAPQLTWPIDIYGNHWKPNWLNEFDRSGATFLRCLGGWQPVPSALNRSTRCLSSWNWCWWNLDPNNSRQRILVKHIGSPLKQFHHDLSL